MTYRIIKSTPQSSSIIHSRIPSHEQAFEILRLMATKLINDDRTVITGKWQLKVLDIDTVYEIERVS